MNEKRVPLYERLPEIYRIKDAEGQPPGQLKAYLALVEEVFGAIHENIESLYNDLFIETCDEWVIPYIGDLLGTSHLKGDPWTLRADVADTIALRRRKGTLGAIERLTYDLTQWGVHCVELRNNLVWNHHLTHQRPDAGGLPPYGLPSVTRHTVVRGGTVTLRDPAMLSLLNTPFDPFAHTADLKPTALGNVRYNLPNLAIFLWRLEAYRVTVSKPLPNPLTHGIVDNMAKAVGTEAKFIAQFYVHPMGEPVQLFNTHRFDPDRDPPVVTQIDETPNPIPPARLTTKSPAGNPDEYIVIDTYNENNLQLDPRDISDVGLQLYLPQSVFTTEGWSFRGANLCAWENSLHPPLKNREIAIDPRIGRIAIGVETEDEAKALVSHLLLTYTYGAVGPVGAHPLSRPPAPQEWNGEQVDYREVNFHKNRDGLRDKLSNIQISESPIVIEIKDSMTHELDLNAVNGTIDEDGGPNLRLNRSLIIRAADNHRPVIKLKQPLRFRPTNVKSTKTDEGQKKEEQRQFDAVIENLTVRLEGLYLTRGDGLPNDAPLIARAALHSLEILDCTLDPGGSRKLDGTPSGGRTPIHPSIRLEEGYSFADANEEEAFNQTPEIILRRTITGPLFIDPAYRLFLTDSIIAGGVVLLFSIELKSQPGLRNSLDNSNGSIPNVLRQKFTNKGIPLSSEATVGGHDPVWLITDKNQKYTLKKAEDQIRIYGVYFAVSGTGDTVKAWGPPTQVNGITVFGHMRVESISGRGGIWVHALEVQDNQKGCIKFSYFSGKGDQLPQNHGCVDGNKAILRFVSEIFGEPAYGQLAHTTDFRIRERGPNDDMMGAFGFLLEAHKWRNIQIRYREFMPVGVRPLLIPVT